MRWADLPKGQGRWGKEAETEGPGGAAREGSQNQHAG